MQGDLNDLTIRWSKPVEKEFLETAEELTIFLKDGYTFFKANAEVLKNRFADPTKKTRVIIVHPDSPNIRAVSSMDPKKSGRSTKPFKRSKFYIQKEDCFKAIDALHQLRRELLDEGRGDCAERVEFIGHPFVPTWNGFAHVGDGKGKIIINDYSTIPERTNLLAKEAVQGSLAYDKRYGELGEIVREAGKDSVSNLWKYPLRRKRLVNNFLRAVFG